MPEISPREFAALYARFPSPIALLDCGEKCAPYNENNVPFCCDTRHTIPTAYRAEWEYLQSNTDLWHAWEAEDPAEASRLQAQAPAGQVLIACQGHTRCQRSFRALACRSFPFFPYFNRDGDFLGLSYYWEYEDRCWVISNLVQVTGHYRSEFIAAYDALFERLPDEMQDFQHYSSVMRRVFGKRRRAIPLLHRNGNAYKVTPASGRMRIVPIESFPAFGPYPIASLIKFDDE